MQYGQVARPISTDQLNSLRYLHLQPINLVIFKGSLADLRLGISNLEVGFALRCFQRLSRPYLATQRSAPGGTIGTPEVRPSWSSRTEDSSSQISCAHDG